MTLQKNETHCNRNWMSSIRYTHHNIVCVIRSLASGKHLRKNSTPIRIYNVKLYTAQCNYYSDNRIGLVQILPAMQQTKYVL